MCRYVSGGGGQVAYVPCGEVHEVPCRVEEPLDRPRLGRGLHDDQRHPRRSGIPSISGIRLGEESDEVADRGTRKRSHLKKLSKDGQEDGGCSHASTGAIAGATAQVGRGMDEEAEPDPPRDVNCEDEARHSQAVHQLGWLL